MPSIEQRQQFVNDGSTAKISRSKIQSNRTAMLVILHRDKYRANTQLKFPWRGITKFVCVVGVKDHPLGKVGVTQLVTDVGGGYPPPKYYQEMEGRSSTKLHAEWFVSQIQVSRINIENIVVNCVGDFPFMLEEKLRTLLPRRFGVDINIYHTRDIERRSR